MPVTWNLQDSVVTLSIVGLVTNHEIATAIDEALASAAGRRGMRLLWDARKTHTPLSAEDMAWRFQLLSSLGQRGIFERGALLLRPEQQHLLELGLMETGKVLRTIESTLFTDEAEALEWLRR